MGSRHWCLAINRGPQLKKTYISKLHLPYLSQSTDYLTSNLVGDVKLGQGHVRRAEQGILGNAHDENIGPMCLERGSIKRVLLFLGSEAPKLQ